MKKIISTIAISLISIYSFSQIEGVERKVEFGFNLGVNRTNIKIDNSESSWIP